MVSTLLSSHSISFNRCVSSFVEEKQSKTYKIVCRMVSNHTISLIVSIEQQTHLVTISPLVVLGANVLVGVLGSLLQRRQVVPVVPMLVPQVVGVGTGEAKGGNDGADGGLASISKLRDISVVEQIRSGHKCRFGLASTSGVNWLTRWRSSSRELRAVSRVADGQLMAAGSRLTGGASGVLLDVLTLLDELVLSGGAGETALSGSADLGGEARGVADDLSCGNHD